MFDIINKVIAIFLFSIMWCGLVSVSYAQESSNSPTPPKCHEVPLLFSKCVPGICIEDSPFGQIQRQIIGYEQTSNTCKFKERTPGFSGLDCSFKANILDNVDQLYTKKFISRFDKSISLTKSESLEIKKINDSNCTFLSDIEAAADPINFQDLKSNIVSGSEVEPEQKNVPKEAQQTALSEEDIFKPEGIDEALGIVEEETNPTEQESDSKKLEQEKITEKKEEANTKDISNISSKNSFSSLDNNDFTFKSLMFTADEIALLNQAIDAFNSGSKLSIGGQDEEGEKTQIRSFFLKSLIYYNPDQWTLWIENSLKTEKITNESNSSGLVVEEIKPGYATIIWQTPNLDKIAPEWKRFLISDSRNRYRHEKFDILVERDEQSIAEVKFRLRPNQTFNVNSMQIFEGRN